MTYVLHVLGNLAAAETTEHLAYAIADNEVEQVAPECVTPQHWKRAGCVLVEADVLDQLVRHLVRQHSRRRSRVVVIVHNLDDASIYASAVALGAEAVLTLPDHAVFDVEVLARTIRAALRNDSDAGDPAGPLTAPETSRQGANHDVR